MKRRSAIVAGERVEIAWNDSGGRLEAVVNGRQYSLETHRLEPNSYWFECNGLSIEARVAPTDQGYQVTLKEHQIPVEFEDSIKRLRRKTGAVEGVVEVRAPMPGKIVRVLRSAGDDVEIHQGIALMEAMKMQNEIRSPKSGKIIQLRVSEGDAVKAGDLIAQVE